MKRRQGFTIVELLVAMALILFMMAILSGAFVASTTAFRNLKAAGDMANKLRATTTLLQRDLSSDHFEGNKRLSDPNFWVNGPPQQGFFRVWQGSPSTLLGPLNFIEGTDPFGIGSYRSTDHALAFTIKLRGNDMSDFLSAGAQGGGTLLSGIQTFGPTEARYQFATGTYNYQWGEVAWFLQPSINPSTGLPDTTVLDPNTLSPPVPLYTLYRRQRLLVPDNNLVQPPALAGTALNFLEMSSWVNGANLYFNNPMDITVPWRRFGMVPLSTYPAGLPYGATSYPSGLWPQPPPTGNWFPPNPTPPPAYLAYLLPLVPYYPTLAQQGAAVTGTTLLGADIQLTDVVSFDVRLLVPDIALQMTAFGNPDPFVNLFTMYPPTSALANTYVFAAPNNYLTPAATPTIYNNPAFYPTTGPMVFDTWSSLQDSLAAYSLWNTPGLATSIPLWNATPSPIPSLAPGAPPPGVPTGPIIQAIQISIRIWDAKTNQTRQVTIVQAM